jgi:hypothetical protein
MRRDQPKLKKLFKEQKQAIELLKRTVQHREHVIEYISEQWKDTQQEVLIASIEHYRLLENKPALTQRYFAINGLQRELEVLEL